MPVMEAIFGNFLKFKVQVFRTVISRLSGMLIKPKYLRLNL